MTLTKSLSFSLGRKRILISSYSFDLENFSDDFDSFSPMKRRFREEGDEFEQSLLETLPQEILIKVICGVNHDDLKQLFHVSKTIREATLIAKRSHFAYSTPSKIKVFRNSIDLIDFNDFEAPNAPNQARKKNRPRIDQKKVEDISVALFADKEEDEKRVYLCK